MNELVPVKTGLSDPKFFEFNQNNSGGSFVYDTYLSEYVIIEAVSSKHANELAEDIGIYFEGCISSDDCPCCGDRWYPTWSDDGVKVPMMYSFEEKCQVPAEEYISSFSRGQETIRIHYLDGRIVECGIYKKELATI